jgi:hypothetical protein
LLDLGVEERLDAHRERVPADAILRVRRREEDVVDSSAIFVR